MRDPGEWTVTWTLGGMDEGETRLCESGRWRMAWRGSSWGDAEGGGAVWADGLGKSRLEGPYSLRSADKGGVMV